MPGFGAGASPHPECQVHQHAATQVSRAMGDAPRRCRGARHAGGVDPSQFRVVVQVAADRLRTICNACYEDFLPRRAQLASSAPDAVERALYDLHDATTERPSPSFEEVRDAHRARIADVVMRQIVRR